MCRFIGRAQANGAFDWAFGGTFMPTGGYQARRPPAHAGPLRSWERVTITVVFVLVAAAITVIMVLTAHPQKSTPATPSTPSGHRSGHDSGHGSGQSTERPRPVGDRRR